MSYRLVVPVGSKAREDGRLWSDVAAENRVDGVEELGSVWCVANGVDGLGIATERLAIVEIPPLPPSELAPLAAVAEQVDLVAAVATMGKALDPKVADPTTAQRLAALEVVVAELASRFV